MSLPEHWSTTRQAMLYRCGEQYRRRYTENEILPPGIALVRGKAVHQTNDLHMKRKMEGGAMSAEEARDVTATAFNAEVASGNYTIDGSYAEAEDTPQAIVAHALDDSVALAAKHATEVAATIEPTASELRIEVPPDGVLPVPFVSILDVIHEGVAPIDCKTASRAPGKSDADVSEQLSGQALAFRHQFGRPERFLRLDVLSRTLKTRKTGYTPLETKRTGEDLEVFVRRANAAIETVDRELWLPAPADSWVCSERWCGYWPTCPFARGRQRPRS